MDRPDRRDVEEVRRSVLALGRFDGPLQSGEFLDHMLNRCDRLDGPWVKCLEICVRASISEGCAERIFKAAYGVVNSVCGYLDYKPERNENTVKNNRLMCMHALNIASCLVEKGNRYADIGSMLVRAALGCSPPNSSGDNCPTQVVKAWLRLSVRVLDRIQLNNKKLIVLAGRAYVYIFMKDDKVKDVVMDVLRLSEEIARRFFMFTYTKDDLSLLQNQFKEPFTLQKLVVRLRSRVKNTGDVNISQLGKQLNKKIDLGRTGFLEVRDISTGVIIEKSRTSLISDCYLRNEVVPEQSEWYLQPEFVARLWGALAFLVPNFSNPLKLLGTFPYLVPFVPEKRQFLCYYPRYLECFENRWDHTRIKEKGIKEMLGELKLIARANADKELYFMLWTYFVSILPNPLVEKVAIVLLEHVCSDLELKGSVQRKWILAWLAPAGASERLITNPFVRRNLYDFGEYKPAVVSVEIVPKLPRTKSVLELLYKILSKPSFTSKEVSEFVPRQISGKDLVLLCPKFISMIHLDVCFKIVKETPPEHVERLVCEIVSRKRSELCTDLKTTFQRFGRQCDVGLLKVLVKDSFLAGHFFKELDRHTDLTSCIIECLGCHNLALCVEPIFVEKWVTKLSVDKNLGDNSLRELLVHLVKLYGKQFMVPIIDTMPRFAQDCIPALPDHEQLAFIKRVPSKFLGGKYFLERLFGQCHMFDDTQVISHVISTKMVLEREWTTELLKPNMLENIMGELTKERKLKDLQKLHISHEGSVGTDADIFSENTSKQSVTRQLRARLRGRKRFIFQFHEEDAWVIVICSVPLLIPSRENCLIIVRSAHGPHFRLNQRVRTLRCLLKSFQLTMDHDEQLVDIEKVALEVSCSASDPPQVVDEIATTKCVETYLRENQVRLQIVYIHSRETAANAVDAFFGPILREDLGIVFGKKIWTRLSNWEQRVRRGSWLVLFLTKWHNQLMIPSDYLNELKFLFEENRIDLPFPRLVRLIKESVCQNQTLNECEDIQVENLCTAICNNIHASNPYFKPSDEFSAFLPHGPRFSSRRFLETQPSKKIKLTNEGKYRRVTNVLNLLKKDNELHRDFCSSLKELENMG